MPYLSQVTAVIIGVSSCIVAVYGIICCQKAGDVLLNNISHFTPSHVNQLIQAVIGIYAFKFYFLIAPETGFFGVVTDADNISNRIIGVT